MRLGSHSEFSTCGFVSRVAADMPSAALPTKPTSRQILNSIGLILSILIPLPYLRKWSRRGSCLKTKRSSRLLTEHSEEVSRAAVRSHPVHARLPQRLQHKRCHRSSTYAFEDFGRAFLLALWDRGSLRDLSFLAGGASSVGGVFVQASRTPTQAEADG